MGERITVKLFATLRSNFSVPDSMELSSPRIIRDIINEIGIPEEKVTIIFVNSRHAEMGDLVRPGDVLSMFPPIGGG